MPTRKQPKLPKDAAAAADVSAEADLDTLTPPVRARVRRNGQPLTDEERAQAQETFLAAYAHTANVSQSAKRARISRETFYQWRDHDETFRARLGHADEDAQDVLRGETFRRAVVGVNEPLTNGQGLIYEFEPVLGPDGEQALDNRGKPQYRRTKIATVKKYSDTLLSAMLKARVPEYRDQKKQLELSGPNGGPIQTQSAHELTINLEGMSVEQVRALRALIRAQDDEPDEPDEPDGNTRGTAGGTAGDAERDC